MVMKNCKEMGKVEILKGICECAEICFENGVKCRYVPKTIEEMEKNNKIIAEICQKALSQGKWQTF